MVSAVELAAVRFEFAAALTLLVASAAIASAATHAVKKLMGAVLTVLAALVALAVIGAPAQALVAGAAAAFGLLVVGVGIAVRLQEAYGDVDQRALDGGDEDPRHTMDASS